ncbi:MAG: 2Fe-2S iron-sulfur cluster-binding protein [Aliiglaciecola sp.]
MISILFVTQDGEETVLKGDNGSVMELAAQNGVAGIDGECGGVCSCATCHVYLSEDDMGKVEAPSDFERDMLELTEDVKPTSRLSCQIPLTRDIDGIRLQVVR